MTVEELLNECCNSQKVRIEWEEFSQYVYDSLSQDILENYSRDEIFEICLGLKHQDIELPAQCRVEKIKSNISYIRTVNDTLVVRCSLDPRQRTRYETP